MSRPAAWAGNRAAVSTNILRNPTRRHRVQGFPLPSVSIDECSSALRPLPTRGSRYGKGRAWILRILLVDDDPGLRTLLRTTFEVADVAVVEAENADAARRKIRAGPPDVIVLDVNMPGTTGLELCAELKAAPETKDIPIVLLAVAERLAGGLYGVPFRATKKRDTGPEEELLLYARDLRHLLELERSQRELLQSAYLETVSALASALESKDTGTRAHSQRVQSYATALAKSIAGAELIREPSTPYGFLPHDVGKIGIPDGILLKPGPLSGAERRRICPFRF